MNTEPIANGILELKTTDKNCLLSKLKEELAVNDNNANLENISSLLSKYASSPTMFKAFYDISIELNKNADEKFDEKNIIDKTTILTQKHVFDKIIKIIKSEASKHKAYAKYTAKIIKVLENQYFDNFADFISNAVYLGMLYLKTEDDASKPSFASELEEIINVEPKDTTLFFSFAETSILNLHLPIVSSFQWLLLINKKEKNSTLIYKNESDDYFKVVNKTKTKIENKDLELLIKKADSFSGILYNK